MYGQSRDNVVKCGKMCRPVAACQALPVSNRAVKTCAKAAADEWSKTADQRQADYGKMYSMDQLIQSPPGRFPAINGDQKMARFQKASKAVDTSAGTVTFNFAHGETLVVKASDVPESIRDHALLHGLSQKIGDSYAGADTAEEAYAAAVETFNTIKGGEWAAAREGVGTGGADLIKAFAEATGKTEDECREVLIKATDEQKKKIKKHPAVAAVLDRIQSEKLLARSKARAAAADESDFDLSSI